jgi:hypothetical protein
VVSSQLAETLTLEATVAAVPELSTWVMIIVDFLGLGFMAYRRDGQGPDLKAAFGRFFVRCNRSRPVDRPRKTLAEFSRVYLRSLECPAIVPKIRGEDDDDHFAAHVRRHEKGEASACTTRPLSQSCAQPSRRPFDQWKQSIGQSITVRRLSYSRAAFGTQVT